MSTLLSLDNDTFSCICQYLKINELVKLEQCNKLLLNTIKSSPHCLVSLNYPECNVYLKSTLKAFDRLSCVKKLYLNNMEHLLFVLQTTDLKKMFNHLTHLTIHSIDPSDVSLPDLCPECTQKQVHFNANPKCVKKRDQHLTINNAHSNIKITRHIAHSQSLQSLTVYSMPYNNVIKILNYINCDILLLKELILNFSSPVNYFAATRALSISSISFWGTLYCSQLTKLCITATGTNVANRRSEGLGCCIDAFHKTLKLFTTLRYFSCKKPGQTPEIAEWSNLTLACHQIITYCKNLEHLEFRDMSRNEYNLIFGDNISIKSNKLKELIIHMSSPKIGNLLKYLSGCNIKLELIDLLLFDTRMERSIFFNLPHIMRNLQRLLLSQLTKTRSLRDIILRFHTQCTARCGSYEIEIEKWNVIQSVYSLLVDIFQNDNIKYRKELNLTLNIFYQPTTNKQKGRMLEYDKLMQLLDILNEKVECCTIIISLHILHKRFIQEKEFGAFLYHLQCNHEWSATIIKQNHSKLPIIQHSMQYTKYRITNCSKENNQKMDDISAFELRLNYEKDGNIVCDDSDKILAAETMIFKIPKFKIPKSVTMQENCEWNTNKIKWSQEHQLTFGSCDIVSVFGKNDKNIDGEANFDLDLNNNDNNPNGWNWHFEWNDSDKK